MTDKICFVIQPFSKTYKNRYKSVYEPAIKDAGLIPYRTGGHSVDDIPEDIRRRIREAHICFADITEDRPNVWYEVGFAHACYKQVVMVCDEEVRPSECLPFDISARNVLFYKGKEVDFDEFYCDGFIKGITKRVKARAEEADSDIILPPVTVQQSQNSGYPLTTLDGNVLNEIVSHYLKCNYPMYVKYIIPCFLGEAENDVLNSIGRMASVGYIERITEQGEWDVGYSPTEKGLQWYYEHSMAF